MEDKNIYKESVNEIKGNGNSKNGFLRYLDKNPDLKERYIEALKARGKSLEDYTDSDIWCIQDCIDYLHYEMTRTRVDGDLLRGRTVTEYNRSICELEKTKEFIENSKAEREAKIKRILEDRQDADGFIKIVCDALTEVIKEPDQRIKLIETIKILYDKQYPNESTEQRIEPTGNEPSDNKKE